MEYRSPLGFNFKLEQSLSTSVEERQESPAQPDQNPTFKSFHSTQSRHHRQYHDSSNRNSYHNSSSPRTNQNNRSWRTPTHRHSNHDHSFHHSHVDITQYFHPSMLEDPWRELELQTDKSK